MKNRPLITTQRVTFFTVILCLMLFAFACRQDGEQGETNSGNGTGGITARLVWHEGPEPNNDPSTNGINFALPVEVTTVRGIISAADMTTMQADFPASAGSGQINGVPPGTGRVLTLRGLNSSGMTIYEGAATTISVVVGQIAKAGTVDMIQPQANMPTTGLVAYYPFNSSANDESGNSINGTESGVTLTTDRFGNGNSAYAFDGVDDNIAISNSVTDNKNAISLSLWIYPTRVSGTNIFYGSGELGLGNGDLRVEDGNIKVRFSTSDDFEATITKNNVFIANNWYHVVVTYDGTGVVLYINGSNEGTVPATGTVVSASWDVKLGCHAVDSNWFQGKIDDIRIYDQALTSEEILKLYTLDNESPQNNSFTINTNSTYTNTNTVTLNISATDNEGVIGYYASQTNSTPNYGDGIWTEFSAQNNYSADVNFTLTGGEGSNTVYVWVKDAAGNVSATANDTIILDTTAPAGTNIDINSGAGTTSSRNVDLDITATDTNGVVAYFYSETNSTPAVNHVDWHTITTSASYSATVTYTLTGVGDGDKTVYVWFKDQADNISTVDSDNITLDTSSTVPTSGLVAYYPFNGNANDESANSNNGTVNGATLTTDRNGNIDSAYNFTNLDYIEIRNISMNWHDNDWTVGLWVNLNEEGESPGFFSNRFGPEGFSENWITLGRGPGIGDPVSIEIGEADSGAKFMHSAYFPTDQGWTYYNLVKEDNVVKLYISGVYDNSVFVDRNIGSTTNYVRLGDWCCEWQFDGDIDEVVIYNRALTTTEIQALYNENPDIITPESPSISINEGTTTDDANVILTLSATDIIGVTGYYLSETNSEPDLNANGWVDVTSDTNYSNNNVAYTIQGGDGDRIIYVWYKDAAGNISASDSDIIKLQLAPTNPSIVINNDNSETTSTSVTLSLSASDDTGVVGYYASNSSSEPVINAGEWVTFTATTNYTDDVSHDLETGDDTKTVYVWFKDAAGNLSVGDSDTIELDTSGSIGVEW